LRRQTLVVIVLALTFSIALGFLIGQLAGGNGQPTANWTPVPTVIGTPGTPAGANIVPVVSS
jgi:hypothetical protein